MMRKQKVFPIDFIDFLILIFCEKGYGSNEFLSQLVNRDPSNISRRIDRLDKELFLIHTEGSVRSAMYRVTKEGSDLIVQTYKTMNILFIESDSQFIEQMIDRMRV